MAKTVKAMPTPVLNQPVTPELLGQAIKARRTQSNLTIEDAAALCGMAKQTLMHIEHGHENCRLKNVLQACHTLGVKLHIDTWEQQGAIDDWQ